MTPPAIQSFFPYQNFSETKKVSSSKFFGTVGLNVPPENRNKHLCINFSDN